MRNKSQRESIRSRSLKWRNLRPIEIPSQAKLGGLRKNNAISNAEAQVNICRRGTGSPGGRAVLPYILHRGVPTDRVSLWIPPLPMITEQKSNKENSVYFMAWLEEMATFQIRGFVPRDCYFVAHSRSSDSGAKPQENSARGGLEHQMCMALLQHMRIWNRPQIMLPITSLAPKMTIRHTCTTTPQPPPPPPPTHTHTHTPFLAPAHMLRSIKTE